MDEREIGGQFVLVATAKQGQDLRKVEKALDEEMPRFSRTKGPRERELQRIKAQSYASFVRGVERIGGFGGKSDILATSLTYAGVPDAYKERLTRLEKLTSLDLRDAGPRMAGGWRLHAGSCAVRQCQGGAGGGSRRAASAGYAA